MVSLDNLNALYACRTPREWHANMAALALGTGFSQFFFGLARDRGSIDGAFISTNYASEWREKYEQEQLHGIDPIVAHCSRNIVPLIWDDADFSGDLESRFYEQACAYGLRSGVSFPMHGQAGEFGIISFADASNAQPFGFRTLSALALIRDFAFASSLQLPGLDEPCDGSTRIRLTPREHDCLLWVMRGKTSWEAAKSWAARKPRSISISPIPAGSWE